MSLYLINLSLFHPQILSKTQKEKGDVVIVAYGFANVQRFQVSVIASQYADLYRKVYENTRYAD